MQRRIQGYSEIGLGTAEPDHWLRFFLDLGGWRVRWEGPGADQPLWPPDHPRPDHEWLLAADDRGIGQVRLFRFENAVPAPRQAAAVWDTGGIFDLDLRVRDLARWADALGSEGWSGFSEPVRWPFGDLQIGEWLGRGPDGVVVALVERLHPPLDPPPPAAGFGFAFNATQAVRDVDATLALFEALGFGLRVRHRGPLGGPGGEMLGLVPERAPKTPVDLAIAHPSGALEGSVELIALPETPGHDLAADCGPGRRGLNLLRFPVQGLDALAEALGRAGFAPCATARWTLPPIGPVRGIALQTPDGAWLECVEPE